VGTCIAFPVRPALRCLAHFFYGYVDLKDTVGNLCVPTCALRSGGYLRGLRLGSIWRFQHSGSIFFCIVHKFVVITILLHLSLLLEIVLYVLCYFLCDSLNEAVDKIHGLVLLVDRTRFHSPVLKGQRLRGPPSVMSMPLRKRSSVGE
jgi:hypothetical protein